MIWTNVSRCMYVEFRGKSVNVILYPLLHSHFKFVKIRKEVCGSKLQNIHNFRTCVTDMKEQNGNRNKNKFQEGKVCP